MEIKKNPEIKVEVKNVQNNFNINRNIADHVLYYLEKRKE